MYNLFQGGNAHYTSGRSITEMLDSLGRHVKGELLNDVRASPAFSILVDETTNVSVEKQLII